MTELPLFLNATGVVLCIIAIVFAIGAFLDRNRQIKIMASIVGVSGGILGLAASTCLKNVAGIILFMLVMSAFIVISVLPLPQKNKKKFSQG